jgi:hypothetical protein
VFYCCPPHPYCLAVCAWTKRYVKGVERCCNSLEGFSLDGSTHCKSAQVLISNHGRQLLRRGVWQAVAAVKRAPGFFLHLQAQPACKQIIHTCLLRFKGLAQLALHLRQNTCYFAYSKPTMGFNGPQSRCYTLTWTDTESLPWQAPPAYSRLFQILFQVSQVGYSQHMELA